MATEAPWGLPAAVGCVLAVLLLPGCGGGGGGGGLLEAPSGPPEFEVFQEAAVVFGQPVFVFNDANQGAPLPGAGTLACPGVPSQGGLFLPDAENHRVLGLAQIPILSNLEANFVLGQPDFQFALPGVGATSMREPTAACIASGRLVVADAGNHRVLVFPGIPTAKGAAAELALGQPDLVSAVPGAGRVGLQTPTAVAGGGGRLVVSDRGNHRVLVWHAMPASSGAPADLVLGQADFAGSEPNRGGACDRDTCADPYGVWTDGTRLVVADRGNHRVLVWTSFPTTNGQPADLILGQADGAGNTPRRGATGFRDPCDVEVSGQQLYVADAGNHRVVFWRQIPDFDGAGAEGVIGQSDFDHFAPNDEDQDGEEDPVSSARTFKSKHGVLTVRLAGRTLFVGDAGNHRLLVFEAR